MANTLNMTVGTPWKMIVRFALPVFLSQLFQQLYNTIDSLIVGNFLGTEALAAVSSSGTLIFLMISFFTGMSMGAGVVISRYFGAGNADGVSRAVHTDVIVSLFFGVALTVIGIIFTPTFLVWMKTDPEVLPEATAYFRYYFAGALAIVLYNDLKGIMNAVGNSRSPLYYLIFSSVLNVILDYVFIGVMHKGVEWAAIATTIAQFLSVILCLIKLTRPGTIYKLSLKKMKIDGKMLVEIFKNGVPSGVQNSVIGFANVLVQTNINSFGKAATAAYGSFSKIEGFTFLPITSFTMALTTYISQNLGAGMHERAKKGARFGIICAVICAEIVGTLEYLLAPFLVSLFSKDQSVIEMGSLQIHTESFFYFLLAFSHAIAAVCRGSGKAFVPMLVMLSVWCVIRIIYITVILTIIHEIQMIYWAYPITWGISSIIYMIYYKFSDWIHGFDDKLKLQTETQEN